MDAVPRRTMRPDVVTGRVVPGRAPLNAPSMPPAPVTGRLDVPGRRKPVMGRPDDVVGRMPWLGMPVCVRVPGRRRDVPGRGIAAVAFSSMRTSATPCVWRRGKGRCIHETRG